jgi:LysM repeat protein
VRVPPGTKAETQRRLVELETEWKGYDAYVIAHGERFEDVATTFGVTVGQLKKLNDVARESEIEGGTTLVVPRITDEQRARNAARARANLHASGLDQKDGELLIVPVPDKTFVAPGKRRAFYRVVAGDTLKGVARALDVRSADLASWNALDPDGNLQARMVLVAWIAPDFDAARRHVNLLDDSQLAVVTRGSPEHMDLAEARTGRVRTEYTAQSKEKLADVAKKFGMGSHDLARINRISYDTVLTKGQTIIVYQVADPNRSKRADDQWKKTPRARRGKLTGSHTSRTASTKLPDSDSDSDSADDDATSDDDPGSPGDARSSDRSTGGDVKREPRRTQRPDAAETDKPRERSGGGGPVTRPAQVR